MASSLIREFLWCVDHFVVVATTSSRYFLRIGFPLCPLRRIDCMIIDKTSSGMQIPPDSTFSDNLENPSHHHDRTCIAISLDRKKVEQVPRFTFRNNFCGFVAPSACLAVAMAGRPSALHPKFDRNINSPLQAFIRLPQPCLSVSRRFHSKTPHR